jgi:hypothetical protein
MRHDRRSVRLPGFDYTAGFTCLLTICAAHRCPVFGCLRDGMVHLSEAGRVADACWLAIPAHFPNVDLDAYSIQPDHLHGIITLRKSGSQHPVGAQHVAPLPSRARAYVGDHPAVQR